MIKRIQSLPNVAELSIVLLLAFGYFILTSLLSLPLRPSAAVLADGNLIGLVTTELFLAAILLVFLFLRGWSFGRLGFGPLGGRAVILGVGLFMVIYMVILVVWTVAVHVFGASAFAASAKVFDTGSELSVAAILLVSIVNPIFEETFLCGYLLSRGAPQADNWRLVNASVAVRLLYHLYQGPVAAITILPTGLVFALWYNRNRQLWPLIIAHGLFDVVGLLPYAHL